MTTKHLKNLLTSGSLANLVSRSSAMLSLSDAVLASIAGPERGHITDVSVSEDSILTIVADSAAWATRLRFHNDSMLEAARRHGVHATRCRVRVRPR